MIEYANKMELRQIATLARSMVKVAASAHVHKHRLIEIVSDAYDAERNEQMQKTPPPKGRGTV